MFTFIHTEGPREDEAAAGSIKAAEEAAAIEAELVADL